MKDENTEDDVPYLVTCTYCGTQTQPSLEQHENDKPFECPVCGAPLEIPPPPKKPPQKPVKRKKQPFADYDALLAERHESKRRSEGELKMAIAVAILAGALCATAILFLTFWGKC